MSDKKAYAELPEESERPFSLIADHPGDTLGRCADVLSFLANELGCATPDDVGFQNHTTAQAGFFWIARTVEDALRYTMRRMTEGEQ